MGQRARNWRADNQRLSEQQDVRGDPRKTGCFAAECPIAEQLGQRQFACEAVMRGHQGVEMSTAFLRSAGEGPKKSG